MTETFVCGCEHSRHDSPNEAIHPMLAEVSSEKYNAAYVGYVCADCAIDCIPDYIIHN